MEDQNQLITYRLEECKVAEETEEDSFSDSDFDINESEHSSNSFHRDLGSSSEENKNYSSSKSPISVRSRRRMMTSQKAHSIPRSRANNLLNETTNLNEGNSKVEVEASR